MRREPRARRPKRSKKVSERPQPRMHVASAEWCAWRLLPVFVCVCLCEGWRDCWRDFGKLRVLCNAPYGGCWGCRCRCRCTFGACCCGAQGAHTVVVDDTQQCLVFVQFTLYLHQKTGSGKEKEQGGLKAEKSCSRH